MLSVLEAVLYGVFTAMPLKWWLYLAGVVAGSCLIWVLLEPSIVLAFVLIVVYIAVFTVLWYGLTNWLE